MGHQYTNRVNYATILIVLGMHINHYYHNTIIITIFSTEKNLMLVIFLTKKKNLMFVIVFGMHINNYYHNTIIITFFFSTEKKRT